MYLALISLQLLSKGAVQDSVKPGKDKVQVLCYSLFPFVSSSAAEVPSLTAFVC